MNVLIIDNNMSPAYFGAANLRHWAHRAPRATVTVRRGPDNDLPKNLKAFDCTIISGSRTSALESAPWIDRMHELIREGVQSNHRMLGVCYGHQAIARALGGLPMVRKAATPEFGWTQIEVMQSNPLFEGLPQSFFSFSAHFEEVTSPPAGSVVFGKSPACAIQAFQIQNKPVFGIQFHPEKSLEDAQYIFDLFKKDGRAGLLSHAKAGKSLYNPRVPEAIFGNFFSL